MTRETLQIPDAVREAVRKRDKGFCRVCGEHLTTPGLHHVVYGGDARGMGGRRVHTVEEIVTVGWVFPDKDCHTMVHSNKRFWQPLLLKVVGVPGATALSLARWQRSTGRLLAAQRALREGS